MYLLATVAFTTATGTGVAVCLSVLESRRKFLKSTQRLFAAL
jgi:hypothetical protein